MKASEIMTRDVVTVTADTSVRVAVALLAEHRIASLPVVDEDGNIIGIVSELDLLRERMPHDPRATLTRRADGPDPAQRVRSVMTDIVICMSENADTADLADLLVDNNVRAVPIINGPDLVGIVSRRDVLRTLLRDDSSIRADVQALLADYSGIPEPWEVTVIEGVVDLHGHFADNRARETVTGLAHTVPGVVRVRTHRHRRS